MLDSGLDIIPSSRAQSIGETVESVLKLAFVFGTSRPEFQAWFAGRVIAGYYVGSAADHDELIEFAIRYASNPPPTNRAIRYQRNAREKDARLREHPDHVASQQSRDEIREQWTGAIRAPNGKQHSFSGQPEKVDEAISLAVAINVGDFTHPDEAFEIARLTGNEFFPAFWGYIQAMARS